MNINVFDSVRFDAEMKAILQQKSKTFPLKNDDFAASQVLLGGAVLGTAGGGVCDCDR